MALIRKRWLLFVIWGIMLGGLAGCGVANSNGVVILPNELPSEVEPEQGIVELDDDNSSTTDDKGAYDLENKEVYEADGEEGLDEVKIDGNGNITETWQETYALLLRTYSEQYDDLHFLLHDIDSDDIPELFIFQRDDWVDYLEVVYTFRDDQSIFLELGEGVTFMPYLISGSGPFLVSAPDNKVGIIAGFTRLGGGLSTSFIVIDGYKLIVKYQGEVSGAREYETITINGEIVLETEFQRVFGAYFYPRLRAYPVTEANIRDVLGDF